LCKSIDKSQLMSIIIHVMSDSEKAKRVLALARDLGILRIRDVTARGIHPEYVRRLWKRGLLMRAGRGLYVAADGEVSVHHTLAEAAKSVPHGVGCLLTALRFHDVGTQSPHQVWMALDRRAARPRIEHPPIRIVRFSGAALAEGVEEHRVEGVPVKVYCPAKTVADCFKYRNKIGLDVAMEALRDCLRQRKCSVDELWHYAKVCRVANVMRPYLEATL
jgi:predicted transcriptional regulator of viral defense system